MAWTSRENRRLPHRLVARARVMFLGHHQIFSDTWISINDGNTGEPTQLLPQGRQVAHLGVHVATLRLSAGDIAALQLASFGTLVFDATLITWCFMLVIIVSL